MECINRHKWIIFGCKHKYWDFDLWEPGKRTSLLVIMLGCAIAAMRRCEYIIKFTNCCNGLQGLWIIDIGKLLGLGNQHCFHRSQKPIFIDSIVWKLDGINCMSQIERG